MTAPVCSPSRAGLLTGRYQNRFGFEFLVSPDAVTATGEKAGLDLKQKTLADHFIALGHTTGCIGKWHLGDTPAHLPMSRGFDYFYGSPGQGNCFLPTLIDSKQSAKTMKVREPGYYLTGDYTCLLLAAFVLAAAPCLAAAAGSTPNLIFILADDLGYGDLGCQAAPDIRTLRLDA